jgi:hypothetical protein
VATRPNCSQGTHNLRTPEHQWIRSILLIWKLEVSQQQLGARKSTICQRESKGQFAPGYYVERHEQPYSRAYQILGARMTMVHPILFKLRSVHSRKQAICDVCVVRFRYLHHGSDPSYIKVSPRTRMTFAIVNCVSYLSCHASRNISRFNQLNQPPKLTPVAAQVATRKMNTVSGISFLIN